MAVQVSPGKAYVRGYEIETTAPTFIDVEKPKPLKNLRVQSLRTRKLVTSQR